MSAVHFPATSFLFGNEEHLSVGHALSERRGRRPIQINAAGEVLFVLAVEGFDDRGLCEFMARRRPSVTGLIGTRQRARALLAGGA